MKILTNQKSAFCILQFLSRFTVARRQVYGRSTEGCGNLWKVSVGRHQSTNPIIHHPTPHLASTPVKAKNLNESNAVFERRDSSCEMPFYREHDLCCCC